jgi:serine/threonine-protein kinase
MVKHNTPDNLQYNQAFNHPLAMSMPGNNIFKTGFILNEKWVIIEFIGKGAMGEVYRAHQLNLNRDVAIKVLSREMLEHYEEEPAEVDILIQRFKREVQAMARIRHPNVLQIFDHGSDTISKGDKSVPIEYIAMEFIPGATLRYTMPEEGLLPETDLIKNWLKEYFLPLLEGVEAIHAHHIVHRDLKPENVLIDGSIPKIADFGLARSIRLKPVTQSIDVKGTPAYMSPEHFFDFKKADQQSDIYSLGKILFEALSGKITRETLPFKSARLPDTGTPFLKKLNRIIQNSTAEEKENRIGSVAELRNQILEALDLLEKKLPPKSSESTRRFSFLYRPRIIWPTIAFILAAAVGFGIWHHIKHDESLETAQNRQPVMEEVFSPTQKPSPSPAKSIRSRDGIVMRYIPGGSLELKSGDPVNKDRTIRVRPFYLDEDKVTNHHFIEFLNILKESLTVREGIVRNKDQIWLYLGKGNEAHDQIIHENGRFYLRKTEYAAYPVVRVTWYGAQAYANHYNKRLLTEYEWKYLNAEARAGDVTGPSEEEMLSAPDQHTHMMSLSPGDEPAQMKVADAAKSTKATPHSLPSPQANGKRYSESIPKEWITQIAAAFKKRLKKGAKGDKVYKSLVADTSLGAGRGSINYRYPWEAFADVGFRCASSINL